MLPSVAINLIWSLHLLQFPKGSNWPFYHDGFITRAWYRIFAGGGTSPNFGLINYSLSIIAYTLDVDRQFRGDEQCQFWWLTVCTSNNMPSCRIVQYPVAGLAREIREYFFACPDNQTLPVLFVNTLKVIAPDSKSSILLVTEIIGVVVSHIEECNTYVTCCIIAFGRFYRWNFLLSFVAKIWITMCTHFSFCWWGLRLCTCMYVYLGWLPRSQQDPGGGCGGCDRGPAHLLLPVPGVCQSRILRKQRVRGPGNGRQPSPQAHLWESELLASKLVMVGLVCVVKTYVCLAFPIAYLEEDFFSVVFLLCAFVCTVYTLCMCCLCAYVCVHVCNHYKINSSPKQLCISRKWKS